MFADVNFAFSMFLLVRYCKSLEEESFHRRSADFLWMLLFGTPVLHPCYAILLQIVQSSTLL